MGQPDLSFLIRGSSYRDAFPTAKDDDQVNLYRLQTGLPIDLNVAFLYVLLAVIES
jgi:hypothetical protein